MQKIQLSQKQVLKYIIIGIKNKNYQAAINLAQDCIDALEEKEIEERQISIPKVK